MDRRSDIYENTEDNHPGECVYANWEKQRDSCILNDQESKQSDKPAGSRCPTLFAVCVSLLCGLLLICIIVMFMKLNTMAGERDQMLIRYDNMTTEKIQLQSERDQLQSEKVQLQSEKFQLQSEKVQLQSKRDQLESERDSLNNSIQQCLRYFITSQKKSWSDSRQDCKAKGADLVIISSKEEQEYLSRRFRGVEAWIGLTDTEEEGKWMWVDRTPLSTKYWWDGEPNDYKQEEDCAVTGSKFAKAEVLTWADYPCTFPVFGLCKKN
ncbi:CD209 antigen-like protein C isoform X2 [Silurus meridionalis]|uniref:CD209 antigen-like protein C isoform X2 n=1 Tax=Silurus meridionalis TaxID=175797 RepID=UPI001EEC995D|nr:CD209 antigen-like protein C isoform X2 [Silurus meridionalis]